MNSASLGNLKWVKELMCIPTLHQLRVVKIQKNIYVNSPSFGNVTRQFRVGVNLRISISQLK